MEIPITISMNGDPAKLYMELFGVNNEIEKPSVIEMFKQRNEEIPRIVNSSVILGEGITLSQVKRIGKLTESLETHVDIPLLLTITKTALDLGITVYNITNSFIDKILKNDWKIKIGDKEITTKDEFQETLDEYMKSI